VSIRVINKRQEEAAYAHRLMVSKEIASEKRGEEEAAMTSPIRRFWKRQIEAYIHT
jgi:hypothetical protein